MKISPLDVRKQTFRTVFRGADSEEVRVFLDLAATEYENALQENQRLTERLRNCEDRLVEYRELDQMLRNSLLTAERFSAEAKEASQHEAEMVIQEAEWRAKQMLEDARERLNRLSDEVRDLQAKKDSYVQHLRSFLEAQMKLLGQNEEYLEGINRLTDEVATQAARARRLDIRPVAPPAPQRPQARAMGQSASVEADEGEPAPGPWADRAPRGSDRQVRPQERPSGQMPPQEGYAAQPGGYAPPPAQTTFPPARGLGRFNRPAQAPPQREPGPGRETLSEEPSSGRPGAERSEGLFEISADDEESPRP